MQFIIIASIHQPSTTTFQLFDQLLLLSAGRTCYFGTVAETEAYFRRIGHPIPSQTNPAEYLLDIVSSDFTNSKEEAQTRVERIQLAWAKATEANAVTRKVAGRARMVESDSEKTSMQDLARPGAIRITAALLHRSFIKSYRDVVAYGIRIVMYMGVYY